MPMLAKFMVMPPPMVPAPITATLRIGRSGRGGGDAGRLGSFALGEEQVAQGHGLGRGHGLHEQLRLAGQAYFQRQLAGDVHRLEGEVRGELALPLAVLLGGVVDEEIVRQGRPGSARGLAGCAGL